MAIDNTSNNNNNSGNNNNNSRNNNNNNNSKEAYERKPFIYVLQEWVNTHRAQFDVKSLSSPQSKQALSPQDDSGLTIGQMVDMANTDDTPMEEWLQQLTQQAPTATEKFLFVCKKVRASDEDTCALLKNLVKEYPQCNWMKITDPQQSNCSLIHMLAQKNKVRCMDYLISSTGQSNEKEIKARLRLLDATDSIAATPLLYATAHNAEDAVAYILSKGNVNTNVKDIYNKFPLLLALRHKNYKIAELLLGDRSTNVHLRGTKGNTVLHTLVEEGDLDGIKFLVEHGASAQRRNNEEENVLFHSLPHMDVAQYLGQHFSKSGLGKILLNVNTSGHNIFHKAANDGFFDSLVVILGCLALGELSVKQIETLLNTPDKSGNTPLILAIKSGRRDMVRFLCKCQETNLNDGDRYYNTPLYYAASSKDHTMASLLTRFGASLKASNRTEEEKETSCFSAVVDRLKSLSTVLTLMLSAFAIVCIVSVAVVCIIFFATNISSSAANLRKKSFGEVVDYVSNSFNTLATSQITAVSQIQDKVDVLDGWDSFRFAYTVYQANYKTGGLIAASSIRLFDGRSAGISINSFTNQTWKSLTYISFDDPLTFEAWIFPNLTTTSWKSFNGTKPHLTVKKPIVWKWITNSADKTETYWSDPYLKAPLTYLFYSLITPIRDQITGTYLGYYALDASVQTINDYLKVKAKENYDSTIVIFETRTQNMVATSSPNVTVYSTHAGSDGTDIGRFSGTNSTNAKVAGMARFLRDNYGSGSLAHAIQPEQRVYKIWTLGAERQALNIARITDKFGLDWVICQTLPTRVFYQTFGISIGVMAGLTVILLILGVILSTIAARLFMRPILILIKQADDIKMLQLDKVEKDLNQSSSSFTEVRTLQESYKSMTARLKQFRQFIPAHILSVIDEEIGLKKKELIEGSNNAGSSGADRDSDGVSVISAANASGMVNRALRSNLNSGCITVMTIRFPDLEEILEQYSADDLVETTKSLVSSIRRCIQESSGQLVSMSSKKSVIVWNTFISQSDHRVRACKTARQCLNEIEELHKEWALNGLPQLHLRIGIASGVAYYGNIGSDSTKFFTIIGAPSKLSDSLCALNKHWGTKAIISDDVYEHAKDDFFVRPFGNRFDDNLLMYELGSSKNSDAWVDEMSPDNKGDIWKAYRDGYDLFQKEMFNEALQVFTHCHNQDPYDVVTQKMMELCHDQNNFSTKSEHDLISTEVNSVY